MKDWFCSFAGDGSFACFLFRFKWRGIVYSSP